MNESQLERKWESNFRGNGLIEKVYCPDIGHLERKLTWNCFRSTLFRRIACGKFYSGKRSGAITNKFPNPVTSRFPFLEAHFSAPYQGHVASLPSLLFSANLIVFSKFLEHTTSFSLDFLNALHIWSICPCVFSGSHTNTCHRCLWVSAPYTSSVGSPNTTVSSVFHLLSQPELSA